MSYLLLAWVCYSGTCTETLNLTKIPTLSICRELAEEYRALHHVSPNNYKYICVTQK